MRWWNHQAGWTHNRVVPLEHLHGDRERAASFGAIASAYDAYRPGYPAALFDDLLRRPVRDALDVGSGTGKVAVELARRGVRVRGVDPDPLMASVARQHGLQVDVTRFEDWEAAGRRFDLITCGHAWHWIDTSVGPEKAADLLRPGGCIARFWNYHVVRPALLESFEAIYAELAPEAAVIGREPTGEEDAPDPFAVHAAFTSAAGRTYRWRRRLTGAAWVGLVETFSDHQRLGPDALARLTAALKAAIERQGGVVQIAGGTYVLAAQRA
jgi:SAM-dependent methyltransferase